MPNRLPRWPGHAGRPFLAASADDAPVAFTGKNFAGWLEPEPQPPLVGFTVPSYFTGELGVPTYRRGAWGRRGFVVRPPRGVLFLNAASILFEDSADLTATYVANVAQAAVLADGLKGTGLEFASGTARITLPASAFGNPHFPDGWRYQRLVGTSFTEAEGEPLRPGDRYRASWVWAMTMGLPGDPALLAGGDLLVFLVAYCDFFYQAADTFVERMSLCYHERVNPLPPGFRTPTDKYAAHYRRFAALVPRLDRFRCVVIRNTEEFGASDAPISAHFRDAIAGAGDYASLGPGLGRFGVELKEITGPVNGAELAALARDHFGVKSGG